MDDFFGLLMVLRVFAVALTLAVTFGLLCSAKLSGSAFLRRLAQVYTVVLPRHARASGAAALLLRPRADADLAGPDVRPDGEVHRPAAVLGRLLAIGLIVGAYITETFRGAFLGVDRGQVEAARALGLSAARSSGGFGCRRCGGWRCPTLAITCSRS